MSELDKVSARLEYIVAKCDDIYSHVKENNGRLRKLEIWRGSMLGGMAIISIILGILVDKFV